MCRQGILNLRPLVSGINQSLLRRIDLSSIKLTPGVFIDFVDHLDAPCLRRLRLSSLLRDPRPSPEDSVRASVSIAHLLQSAISAPTWPIEASQGPPVRRNGGRAPNLEFLCLSGTRLTPRGGRIIVASIIGSRTRPSNRSLFYLSLNATTYYGEVDEDEDQPPSKRAKHSTVSCSSNSHDTRQQHTHEAQDEMELAVDDPRVYSHVTSSNWEKLLNDHLWQNQLDKYSVNMASLRLLPIARVLGCRSRMAPPPCTSPAATRIVNFAALPTELKLEILRSLDDERALSEAQFQRVVQWACDSSTIGYGGPNWRPPVRLRASSTSNEGSQPPAPSTSQDDSLVPTHPWPWAFMISSGASLPRDWDAEAWDESMQGHNFSRLYPHSNGVDDIAKEDDISYEAWPKSVRERWHGPADGAMLAFWDATRTDVPESG